MSIPNHQSDVLEHFNHFDRTLRYYASRIIGQSLITAEALQISITTRCNLNCVMCVFPRLKKKSELTSAQIRLLIRQGWKLGVKELSITGGEPLLNKDILDIIKENNDLHTCLNTNATLINRSIAKKIVGSGLSVMVISVDGAKPETHDRIRQIKGCFELTLKGIKNVLHERKKAGVKHPIIVIAYTINNENCGELSDIISLASELGVDEIHFHPIILHTYFKKLDTRNPLWIQKDKLETLKSEIDKLIEIKKSDNSELSRIIGNSVENLELLKKYFEGSLPHNLACYKSFKIIEVSAENKLFFCGKTLGNLSKRTIAEVLNSPEIALERKKLKSCTYHCLSYCATIEKYSIFENPIKNMSEKLLTSIDLALNRDFKAYYNQSVIAISATIETLLRISSILHQYINDVDCGKEARSAIEEFQEIRKNFEIKLATILNSIGKESYQDKNASNEILISSESDSHKPYILQIEELQRRIEQLERQISDFRTSKGYRYLLHPLDKTYKALFRNK